MTRQAREQGGQLLPLCLCVQIHISTSQCKRRTRSHQVSTMFTGQLPLAALQISYNTRKENSLYFSYRPTIVNIWVQYYYYSWVSLFLKDNFILKFRRCKHTHRDSFYKIGTQKTSKESVTVNFIVQFTISFNIQMYCGPQRLHVGVTL